MDVVIIAHFITEFVKDGTSRFVYIAEHLSRSHKVELITSGFDHITKKQRVAKNHDLQTEITLLEEPSYSKNVCLKRFLSHKSFGKQVKKYLAARKKPDIIYCAVPSLDCAYYAAKYAKKNNVKFIIDVQDLWPESFKMVFSLPVVSDLIFYPMKRKAAYVYACADKIVGVSETYCSLAKSFNRKNAECIPVFLGTKLSYFDKYAAENKVRRTDDKFVVGYCGTLGHSYDIKCVIDAVSRLKDEGKHDVCLWVMGDGPLKNGFQQYAKEKSVEAVFYGRVSYDKMCGMLSACDICVNPIVGSSVASVINKHADYAAAGIPVINTQASAEYIGLIDKYGCGINCQSSNAEEVARAILRLYADEEKRALMGSNARRMAEELFDRDNSYTGIYRLFSEE